MALKLRPFVLQITPLRGRKQTVEWGGKNQLVAHISENNLDPELKQEQNKNKDILTNI